MGLFLSKPQHQDLLNVGPSCPSGLISHTRRTQECRALCGLCTQLPCLHALALAVLPTQQRAPPRVYDNWYLLNQAGLRIMCSHFSLHTWPSRANLFILKSLNLTILLYARYRAKIWENKIRGIASASWS